MADSELTDLTNLAAPDQADLLYVVADPAGTPADRKATVKAIVEALILTGGDVTKAAASQAATIANDAVTFAKMQNIATDRLLGRETAASGDVEEISLGGGLVLASTTLRQSQAFVLNSVATGGHSPADATTYYFSNYTGFNPGPLPITAATIMPRAGAIRRCYLKFQVFGTLASAGSLTVSVRNDTAGTSEQVTASLALTATDNLANNTAMSLAVSAGDVIAIQFLTPTWATNPTAVIYSTVVEVEFS